MKKLSTLLIISMLGSASVHSLNLKEKAKAAKLKAQEAAAAAKRKTKAGLEKLAGISVIQSLVNDILDVQEKHGSDLNTYMTKVKGRTYEGKSGKIAMDIAYGYIEDTIRDMATKEDYQNKRILSDKEVVKLYENIMYFMGARGTVSFKYWKPDTTLVQRQIQIEQWLGKLYNLKHPDGRGSGNRNKLGAIFRDMNGLIRKQATIARRQRTAGARQRAAERRERMGSR